jgi:hypothetical protein
MMTENVRYESIQEPLDEEERELMNPDNYDWENPVEVHVVGEPGTILRLRLSFAEYDALFEAARGRGLPTDESIKAIALKAIQFKAPTSINPSQPPEERQKLIG